MPLLLLSPAKTMDFSNVALDGNQGEWTSPLHLYCSKFLINELKPKSTSTLKTLLGGVSDQLASLNHQRFQELDATPLKKASLDPVDDRRRGGGFAYDGPAFKGLAMASLDTTSQNYLQDNLRILSGLYGTVRPKDLIQPYRLCMSTKLTVASTSTKNLYEFWKAKELTQSLAKEFSAKTSKTKATPVLVVNCASQEYSAVVVRKDLPDTFTWVDCVFKDSGRVLSFFAKRARGLMCRYCAENNVQTVEDLKGFNLEGYTYVKGESTSTSLVFGRVKPPPASATKKSNTTTPTKSKTTPTQTKANTKTKPKTETGTQPKTKTGTQPETELKTEPEIDSPVSVPVSVSTVNTTKRNSTTKATAQKRKKESDSESKTTREDPPTSFKKPKVEQANIHVIQPQPGQRRSTRIRSKISQ